MNEQEILKQAIKLEQDGLDFYLAAAARSSDDKTVTTFKHLAEEERHHLSYLQRQLSALDAGQTWQVVPELDGVVAIDAAAPVFPRGLSAPNALPENPSDEEAILFAMGAEHKSFELYSESAAAGNDIARALFSKLAAVERAHFDQLMSLYEDRFNYPR